MNGSGKTRILFFGAIMVTTLAAAQQPHKWAIVLHGGAGVIERSSMNPKTEDAYRDGLTKAIDAGAQVLDRGGSSLDAVEAAIRILEDDPLFNAGRGSVFAADGSIEMDAAIMNGATLQAGAVADVTHTRHPISLARAVMEKSPHVFLVGPGADAFSEQAGLEQEPQSYFFTERRWRSLVKQLQDEGLPIPPRPEGAPPPPTVPEAELEPPLAHKWGTVRVVRARSQRKYCRRHFNRRNAGQALGTRRRLADYRRGNVRIESFLRGVGNGHGRIFHSAYCRPARFVRW